MTTDFSSARRNMVDCQIRTFDVTNPEVLAAFGEVPREAFVPEDMRGLAYVDREVQVAPGRYLAAPARLARLVQAATPMADEIVLVVGCATGYSAAILSLLCSSVVALESDSDLAAVATGTLSQEGYGNVAVVEGDLAQGYRQEGLYDLVFVDGAIDSLPETLANQLKEGGRLIAVEGHGNSACARLWVREEGRLSSRHLFNCAMAALPGFEKTPEFEF